MKKSTQVFIASCIGSLFNAIPVTPYAAAALREMAFGDSPLSLLTPLDVSMTTPSPDSLVVACGITCGYFLADCAQMLRFPAENLAETIFGA